MPRRPALRSRPLVRPLAALLVCFQECSLAGSFHFQNPMAISIVWFPPPSYPGPRVHRCASHWRERLGSAVTGTGAPGAGNCAPYSHLCPSGGTCSGSSSRSDPLPALAAVTGPGCQRWLGDTDTVPSGTAGMLRLTSLSRNPQGTCRDPNPLLLLKGLCVGFPGE